jgi:multiple sugar transport system substrate-binding protein
MNTKKPFSRRNFLAGAAATGTALAAESLVPRAVQAARSDAPVKITYWYPWGGDSQTYEENRFKTFNATHSDIQATGLYVPPDSGVTNGKLLAAIAAGNPPDLVVTNLDYAAADLGYQGGLLDLTPYLKTVGWKPSDMLPGVLPLMQYSGKIWALPETGNLTFFYYNKALFRKAGLDPNKPPTTFAELDAYAEKLTSYDSSGRFKTIGFIPWAWDGADAWIYPWLFGANFTKTVNGKVELTLTDPATVRALEWEATYAKKYGVGKLQTTVSGFGNTFSPNDPFINGTLAMAVGGNYHTEAIRTYNPKLDYGVTYLPVPPGGRKLATEFSFNIYMVPVGSKHPLQAVQFAMWAGNGSAVIGNENIWRTFSGYKQGPNAPKNIWQQHHDPIYAISETLQHSPNVTNGVLLPISAQLFTEMQTAEQTVYYLKSSAQKALSDLQSRMQPLLDKALKQ